MKSRLPIDWVTSWAGFRCGGRFSGPIRAWAVRRCFRFLQAHKLPSPTPALQRSREAEIRTAAEPRAPESGSAFPVERDSGSILRNNSLLDGLGELCYRLS